jgi:hypothetical protein
MTDDRNLTEFANPGQVNPTPRGHALGRPTSGIAERIIGAQPVAEKRDLAHIRQNLKAQAAFAGEDWFYRFPVRQQGGGTSYIEGPSIKLAMNVAREFGNCAVEIREIDVGDAWTFYARFTDIETGFSAERSFHQRKSQVSLKTKDVDRQQDIAYQIGQSKAIRNAIVNAIGLYTDFAFNEARNSLVNDIGKDLEGWRARTLKGLTQKGYPIERVERAIGRAAKDWLAPDVAQIVAMSRTITDGMATLDETFPPIEQPAPAAAAPSPTTSQSQTAGGGAQTESTPPEKSAAEVASSASPSETAEKSAAADTLSQTEIAFQRGVTAKAEGKRRAHIPREYTDGKHDELAAGWLKGFDEVQPNPQEGKSNG